MKPSIRQVIGAILALFVLAQAGTLLASTRSTETRVLAGMRQIMDNVSGQTADRSHSFLQSAQATAVTAAGVIELGLLDSGASRESYFLQQLAVRRHLSSMFYGTNEGEFWFVNRSDQAGPNGFRTKIITVTGGERRVELTRRDASWEAVEQWDDPADTYDPRLRSWYQSTVAADAPVWTDPYIFFSSQVPGVTTTAPVHDATGAVIGVVGADVDLVALSSFLDGLDLGERGSAFVVNREGSVIALSEPDALGRQTAEGGFRLSTVGEVGGAAAAATTAGFGGTGTMDLAGTRYLQFEFEGARHHAVFEPLEGADWILGVLLQEDDFLGALRATERSNTVVALVLAAGALVLGIGLARNVTRPLEHLRRRAAKVQVGEFDGWVPIKTGIRELRATADAFGQMVEGLHDQERKNATLLDELEERVERRTGELRREIAERELAEAAAAEASRAKSAFLANMSHEMRTPLNAILGLSELMAIEAYGPLGDARYGEYARDIHDAGDHLLSLISDILDLARIEAGKLELDMTEVQLGSASQAALRMLTPFAAQRGIRLTADVPDDLPGIWADDRRIRQIIINLATNSIKFTETGGEVVISAHEAADRSIDLTVTDTGIGMTGEELERALADFGQIAGPVTSAESGSGLGLPITRRLVEAHEGAFRIESTPGVGTTATVTFSPDRRSDEMAATA